MANLETLLNKTLMPLAEKVQRNKILGSLMEGFIRASPITIGVALITIVGNFPINAWIAWLKQVGLTEHINAITNGATGVLSLYVIYSLAMSYAKRLEVNQRNAAIISLAFFIMIMPQTVASVVTQAGKQVPTNIGALRLDYLGGQGIFIGMLVALIVTRLYAYLNTKNLVIKLPSSVPPMVTQSLAPVFVVTIIFIVAFAIRVLFSFTKSGNIFDFFVNTISAPLNLLVASPLSIIIIMSLLSLLWFFGIHNAVLQGPLSAITLTMISTNIAAYQNGQPLPYLVPSIVAGGIMASNFLGIVTIFMFKAKSAKMKQLAKLSFVPSLFGITEPIMFGMPIILNPIFFIPQILPPIISGFLSWGLVRTILPVNLNPTTSLMPWTTPVFVKTPLAGGINYTIIMLICFAVTALIWYPFIKIADKKEYQLEMESKAETEMETAAEIEAENAQA
ncbi:PTS system oligo-beta-mannoside-specific EIIC component [Listeria grayi]|uniref:Permease IIC component n=1 Tax=Listeria grayi FSL F6-1183 TaxID=1265827 RepID=A0A829RBW4_LISGR|nr:PTS transporter subunit EIIC [Listeria grayi]EUJ30582.1 PTS system cellobiose-specific transporter subunit IIC [Listeria grayi FSL F6-1183]VEI31930.1 PTS system oligo-beta-mannoside-specific EIIC component [Listeria grayi]